MEFPGEYVSITYPDGDITLAIKEDGLCTLEKKIWDPKKLIHTEIRVFKGSWILEENLILVEICDSEAKYKLGWTGIGMGKFFEDIKSLIWLSSSIPTFFDSIDLIERDAFDTLAKKAIGDLENWKSKNKKWWEFWKK